MKILIDIDGVLADFVGGICKAHGKENPYLIGAPETNSLIGTYDIEKSFGMKPADFWAPCDENFWYNLEPLEDGFTLVNYLVDEFGINNLCLLSSPTLNYGCIVGKIRWIGFYYPKFARRFLIGPRKEFCAAPGNLLIDDSDHNVREFMRHGGNAVLYPALWNTLWRYTGTALKDVMEDFNEAVRRHRQ